MEKLVIYSRVSTEEQDYNSQIDDLKKWTTSNNYKIIDVFAEKVSGYDLTKERVEYDKMRKFVVDKKINNILTWELSRFGRSSLNTLNEIDYFSKKGVNIIFYKENLQTLSDDLTNKLLLSILTSMAEMERDTIVERSKRGRRMSASQGKRTGFAIMPYGYKDIDGYIQIDEEESKVIKIMYDLVLQGNGARTIANQLNALGIESSLQKKGRKKVLKNGKVVDRVWKSNTVRNILKNPLYKGERHYSGQIIKVPAIVDEDIWAKAQQHFEKNIGYQSLRKYEYLLQNKLVCGSCGYKYSARTENRYNHKPSFYYCTAIKDKSIKCHNGQFKSSVLDKLVYDLLFRHEQIMVRIYKDAVNEFNIEEKNKEIEYYQKEIKKEYRKKERVVNLYKEEFIDEVEFREEVDKIKKEVIRYEKEITKIERQIEVYNNLEVETIESFKSLKNETNFDIKRGFINKYVDEIKLFKVTDTGIDFTQLTYWDLSIDAPIPKKIKLRNPHGNDKVMYIELYAFSKEEPIKAVVSSVSELCYSSKDLEYKDGLLTLNNK